MAASGRARLGAGVALIIGVLTGVSGIGAAQEPPPESSTTTTTIDDVPTTTTSTTTTSTTVATTTTVAPTTTTRPRTTTTTTTTSTVPSTTSTTLVDPVTDPAADGDAPPETVPPEPVVVPPGEVAVMPLPGAVVDVREVSARAAEAIAVFEAATAARQALEARVARLRARVADLGLSSRLRVEELSEARAEFRRTAVDAYMNGTVSPGPAMLLDSGGPNDFYTRRTFLRTVLGAAEEAADRYARARRRVAGAHAHTAEDLADAQIQLEAARLTESLAQIAADSARFELEVYTSRGSLAIHGFVFPVDEPHTFSDTFGAARMRGTRYAHSHQGTDIFAPTGTALLAVERGVIVRMGTDVLGGIKLWVKGESGTYYYYAHLSGFAPGINDGTVVGAGAVLGYVGNTGNARTTPPHLHFEVHPDGGDAVNPYAILVVADEQQRAVRARLGAPVPAD